MATSAQTIVDAIDAAILSMIAGGGAQSVSVGGRTVTFHSLDALRNTRQDYAALAASEAGNKLPFKLVNFKTKGVNGAD
jgi:hypothetical protein